MTLDLHQGGINYAEIPLVALRHSTRSILSQALNGTKIIPSPSNLPRDWRGLAHLAEVVVPHANCPDPTAAVLAAWEKKENSSVQKLIDSLKEIDRFDVIDDSADFIEKDVSNYRTSQQVRIQYVAQRDEAADTSVLTIDDVYCIENCGQPQYYDAFLLFDESDSEFAQTILYKLENEYGLKLCCKDRDLIGGLPFEHEAIMQLIRDRCRRLIVVVSPLFLESSANKFFLSFAQAIGIEQQQRKIIPCVYSKFKFPPQLHYYFVLDYTRSSTLWNFWDRLSQSIRASSPSPQALPPSRSPGTIVELPEACGSTNLSLPAERWDGKKLLPISEAPSAPPCEIASASVGTSRKSEFLSNENVDKEKNKLSPKNINEINAVDSSSSNIESLYGFSDSEPMLNSRASSTASLLSAAIKKPIKSKWPFKKKKKQPVAA